MLLRLPRMRPLNSKGKGKIHDIIRWFIKNLRIIDPLFVKMDDVSGYVEMPSSRQAVA